MTSGVWRRARRGGRWASGAVLVPLAAFICATAGPVRAQVVTDTLVLRALELEGSGKPRDAAPLYRQAVAGADAATALLGLERVYAELGLVDSLVAPVTEAVRRMPGDATVRAVQLRTLHTLRQDDALRAAARDWARAAPRDPSPYRELARLLLADGRTSAADSVIAGARRALGSVTPLAQEVAQLRAAAGAWEESAAAWRLALEGQPWLSQFAAHALAPTPPERRAAVREALLAPPVVAPPRLALAALETRWGSAALGWDALRDLRPDSAAAEAWIAFAELAEADGRYAQARIAYEAALGWREGEGLRVRAASAALAGGDAAAALRLAPMPRQQVDSQQVAEELLPLHVTALGVLGRAAEAERLVGPYDRFLAPGPRARLARELAMGWARTGDLAQARRSLAAGGEDADSSAAAGWIALFEGDAAAARAILSRGDERNAEVALALGVLARFKEERAPEVGRAFLTLARRDTAGAAGAFASAAARVPQAAPLLILTAARLRLALDDTTATVRLIEQVATAHADSPEAPQALLLLARVHIARGQRTSAIGRLEQLILTYPASALVPLARRELELAQQPPASSP